MKPWENTNAAPNGQPINENFTNWFGDSIISDQNGTPLVVYHGTGNLSAFEAFDPKFTGRGNDQLGSGFYFTTSTEEASSYSQSLNISVGDGKSKIGGDDSPGVLMVYLSIKNPLVIEEGGQTLNHAGIELTHQQAFKIISKAPNLYDLDSSPIGDWVDVWAKGKITEKMIKDVAVNYKGSTLIQIENDFFKEDSESFRHAAKEVLGFDGVIQKFKDKTHYVAWFPEQIKSVFNHGDFDPESPSLTDYKSPEDVRKKIRPR